MTGWDILGQVADALATLAWPAVVAYGFWGGMRLAARWAPQVAEPGNLQLEGAMPDDLVGLVAQYEDEWAQDAMRKVIMEKYQAYGDWNLVRKAVGIGKVASPLAE